MKRSGLVLILLATLVSGCVGYRLGTTLPPGIRSIFVPPFSNKTGEPGLEATTTQATIREFQQDGTLRIATEDLADAYLDVQIRTFRLEPLSYEDDYGRTANEYRLVIIAQVEFFRSATHERLSVRLVRGESTFEPTGDLALGKQDALPDAAEDLAHQIVKSVVEYW